ncbi:hypothetical protein A2U01_0036593, partial [Trifolium medium]|nr:hypothetical protein [Trifolium medium]
MARCAVHSAITGILSGSCASRSLVWRDAPLNQIVEDEPQTVARRAGWFGAARQFKKNQILLCNGQLRVAQGRWRRA